MILDKTQFAMLDDANYSTVKVPEFGEGAEIRIRSLTADQRQRLLARMRAVNEGKMPPIPGGDESLACAMGMVDEKGIPLFSEADSEAIGRKHPALVTRISNAIWELSAMTKASQEDLEKNSKATPNNNA